MQREDIDNRFTHHAPSRDDVDKMKYIRGTIKQLAHDLNALVPDSREKSLAITALEEAVMWANAGIARNKNSSERV